MAKNDDGDAVAALMEKNEFFQWDNWSIDWHDLEPNWLVAEHDGEIVGCIQVVPAKPIGRMEVLSINPDLSLMMRYAVTKALTSHAVGVNQMYGAAGGGSSKQKSRTYKFNYEDVEEELIDINLDTVRSQVAEIVQQMQFQQGVFAATDPAIARIQQEGRVQAGLFTDQELRQQFLDRHARQQGIDAAQDELRQLQLEQIRQGPGATAEQRELINRATEAQIARGEADITDFGRNALNLIAEELAPSRGLRPTDTPIQDRAFRVGEQLVREQGRLVSDLRGAQAQAELNFPLAANQSQGALSQFQQQLNQSAGDFSRQLEQQAMQNRMNLFGQTGQLGLGLISSTQPASNLQQAIKPQLGQFSKGSTSQGQVQIPSSRAVKRDNREIDKDDILEALLTLPVEKWRYIFPEQGQHGDRIGTYAEDFSETFGVGDGKTINVTDALGVVMAAIQALWDRIEKSDKGGV
jgi:hypothetical protein